MSSASPQTSLSPTPGVPVSAPLPVASSKPPVQPSKQRKKPGPKPKAKASKITVLKISPDKWKSLPEQYRHPTLAEPSAKPGTQTGMKRKGVPGPKPGTKRRAPGTGPGKPGRKKAKFDPTNPNGAVMNGVTGNGKSNPKANMGAINSNLRSLDRSGKPCKRWQKDSFTLKTFTGVQISIPKWSTPIKPSPPLETPAPGTSVEPSLAGGTPPEIKIISEISQSTLSAQGPMVVDSMG